MQKAKMQIIRTLGTLLLFFVFALEGQGQSSYWKDGFELLPNWNLEDNWTYVPGEIVFSWEPVIASFDCSATSEQIYLDDHVDSLVVSQYLNVFTNSETEFAQIILETESGDITLWEHALSDGSWGEAAGSEISFSLIPYQGQNIRIRFRTWGEDSFNWTSWDVYDVSIYASYAEDISLLSIDGPHHLGILQSGYWEIKVGNMGATPIHDYTVALVDYLSGDVLHSQQNMDTLSPGEVKEFLIEYTPDIARNTFVTGNASFAGDEFIGNNVSPGKFLRVQPDLDINVLFWDNDNNISDILNPETGQMVTAATGFKIAFNTTGIAYEEVNSLPESLDGYDMILATMGSYCLS